MRVWGNKLSFSGVSRSRFPRGEAAPVRTLGLKRNAGSKLNIQKQKQTY